MHSKQDLPVSLHFRVNINYLHKSYGFIDMGRKKLLALKKDI